jgi:hypothetical protein
MGAEIVGLGSAAGDSGGADSGGAESGVRGAGSPGFSAAVAEVTLSTRARIAHPVTATRPNRRRHTVLNIERSDASSMATTPLVIS